MAQRLGIMPMILHGRQLKEAGFGGEGRFVNTTRFFTQLLIEFFLLLTCFYIMIISVFCSAH